MQRVFAVRFSADGSYVFSGSDDMNVRVWKARAPPAVFLSMLRAAKALAQRPWYTSFFLTLGDNPVGSCLHSAQAASQAKWPPHVLLHGTATLSATPRPDEAQHEGGDSAW